MSAETVAKGRDYEARCVEWVTDQGWTVAGRKHRHASGIELDILAVDLDGLQVGIECKGGDSPPGLRRSDNCWKVLGQTLALYNWNRAHPLERLRFLVVAAAQPADDEGLAIPLRVAEANGQLTIVVVP